MSFDFLKISDSHWITQSLTSLLTLATQAKPFLKDKEQKKDLQEVAKKVEAVREQMEKASEADDKNSIAINERKIQKWMDSLSAKPHCYHCSLIKDDKEKAILEFFRKWPKADQHQHGEAIISANEYAEYAAKEQLYFNPKKNKLTKRNKKGSIAISDAASKEALKALMNINNCPKGADPNEFFFNTSCSVIDSITKIMPFAEQDQRIVAELVKENHTYAPIMIDIPQLQKEPSQNYKALFKSEQFIKILIEIWTIIRTMGKLRHHQIDIHRALLNLRYKLKPFLDEAWKELQSDITESVKAMEEEFAKAYKQRMAEHGKQCPTIKYIVPVMRDLDPDLFFQQTAIVFALMQDSKLVRGYQLVGSETSKKAKKNYLLQMLMIDFFRRECSRGNVFLHTGELSKSSKISTTDYYNRIYETINLGCADIAFVNRKVRRISHATSLKENDLFNLKVNNVCVEVCITSNEKLLGIKTSGKEGDEVTPLHVLKKYGIPFTICADDPTHLGTTLSKELARAVLECGLTYKQIKNSQRVLRHYSPELDGESIYEPHPDNPGLMLIRKEFENIAWRVDAKAKEILEKSEMAREQVKWEQLTTQYEEEFVKANNL